MRALLMSAVTSAALLTGFPSVAEANDKGLIIIAPDNSDSFPVFVDANIARSAANTAARAVAGLRPGDRVIVRSFGLAGIASRQIDIDVTVGRKAQSRPRRLAGAIGDVIRSLPQRVARGDIEIQSRTNIIGFIEALAPSLDCEATPTRIILFTDGIEWSTQVRGDALLSGEADLPAPTGPILKGCVIEMRGLGQQTAALGTDSRWFPVLHAQWSAFFSAAGAASFSGFAEFQ